MLLKTSYFSVLALIITHRPICNQIPRPPFPQKVFFCKYPRLQCVSSLCFSLVSPYLDHIHQFIVQKNDSNTVKRVINRVTELLIKKCLTGENYKKYRIGQNQRSCKEYCFACVNVESTFKLLLMRRFTEMIDQAGTNFKSFFIFWVFVV